jgi:hypothetical protein
VGPNVLARGERGRVRDEELHEAARRTHEHARFYPLDDLDTAKELLGMLKPEPAIACGELGFGTARSAAEALD